MLKEKEYKNRNFIIAEILACLSFVLNTISVVMAKEIYGPGAPAWLPSFNFIYYLKTILAITGLFFFFYSGVFTTKEVSRYVSISTLIILWYSIPIINFFLYAPLAMIFSIKQGSVSYEARIPTQITWSIPVVIILANLLIKFKRSRL